MATQRFYTESRPCIECPRMFAHILNIFIEKINGARRVWFSPHDSRTVKVIRSVLILSSTHECANATVSGHLNTGWILCEQQRELRSKCSKMEKVGEGGRDFLSSCFM
jgi:hypothetical protein